MSAVVPLADWMVTSVLIPVEEKSVTAVPKLEFSVRYPDPLVSWYVPGPIDTKPPLVDTDRALAIVR